MSRLSRIIALIICVIIFACTAPAVVLYAKGYRLGKDNQDNINVVQTGTIFLRSMPKQVELLINNKNQESNKAPFKINGLEPGEYHVQLVKSEYHSWQKTLLVKAQIVTKAENILLLPKKPEQTKLNSTMHQPYLYALSFDNKTLAYASAKSLVILDLTKTQTESTKNLENTEPISLALKEKIQQIIFSFNNKNLLIKTAVDWQVFNIEQEQIIKKFRAKNPQWLNSQEIIYFNNNHFYTLDVLSGATEQSREDNLPNYEIEQKVRKFLNIFDLDNFKIKSLSQDRVLVLDKNKNLYLIDFNHDLPVLILDQDIIDFHVAPDNKKALFYDSKNTYIYYLENILDRDPQKKESDLDLIYQSDNEIKQALWYKTSEHVVFLEKNNIIFIELDKRDSRNKVEFIFGHDTQQIISADKKLYYLDNKNLFEAVVEEKE
ncbi:hypothetical protein CL633_03460 [bacterium]|nr:hypothetical protein [bacterium]|tara:strand:+ start:24696 stop:25994 length:1299 start_codon:yes stop_codon:yes gene_type:complete